MEVSQEFSQTQAGLTSTFTGTKKQQYFTVSRQAAQKSHAIFGNRFASMR